MRVARILALMPMVLLGGSPIAGCWKGGGDAGEADSGYTAPRNPGESIESWAGELQPAGGCNPKDLPNEDPKFCVPGHLETIWLWPGHMAFIGLVDLDYDYRQVFQSVADGAGGSKLVPYDYETSVGLPLTVVKVRRVIEEYWNVLGGAMFEEVYVQALCDQLGHCESVPGAFSYNFKMPLWSGVNLVYGYRLCHLSEKALRITRAYAVEAGKVYDFFGKSGDFEPIRKALIENCSAWDRPLVPDYQVCTQGEPRESSPSEPEDTSDFEMVPIPLPQQG